MVHIEVHNCNLLDLISVAALEVRRCQRYVVQKAESIGARLPAIVRMESLSEYARVVTGRPGGAERVSCLATHDCISCFDRGTSCQQ